MSPREKKVAIVTGAGSGMGEGLSRDLFAKGWMVACVDIDPKAGTKLVDDLGSNAKFFQADVASYDSQARMFQQVWDTWGRIDALLANAGIVDRSSIYILGHRNKDEVPPAPDTSCTDVDYKGVVYGTQLAIHYMRKNATPGGKIIATASGAALYPHPSYPEYCGAKAAVLNFVRCVAPVLKLKENISINTVLPGIVATNIMPKAMLEAVPADCLTPVSTIVRAYNMFLDDDERNGEAVECSAEKILNSHQPEYLNGRVSKRATTVWEPLFFALHKETSDLPGSVQ